MIFSVEHQFKNLFQRTDHINYLNVMKKIS